MCLHLVVEHQIEEYQIPEIYIILVEKIAQNTEVSALWNLAYRSHLHSGCPKFVKKPIKIDFCLKLSSV
jgi:hypothetical protein